MERLGAAALGVACALVAASLPARPEPPPPCAKPASLAVTSGQTREVGCAGGSPLRGPARLLFGLTLDPNRATARTLEVLPGIGPARAAAIVRARAHGPFRGRRDLARVRGIGPTTVERLAGWIPDHLEGARENR